MNLTESGEYTGKNTYWSPPFIHSETGKLVSDVKTLSLVGTFREEGGSNLERTGREFRRVSRVCNIFYLLIRVIVIGDPQVCSLCENSLSHMLLICAL